MKVLRASEAHKGLGVRESQSTPKKILGLKGSQSISDVYFGVTFVIDFLLYFDDTSQCGSI